MKNKEYKSCIFKLVDTACINLIHFSRYFIMQNVELFIRNARLNGRNRQPKYIDVYYVTCMHKYVYLAM